MTLQDAKQSLMEYEISGQECGGFLMAVLENSLFDAMGRADTSSRENLFEIVSWIYNTLPMCCYGSKMKVKDYQKAIRSDKGL